MLSHASPGFPCKKTRIIPRPVLYKSNTTNIFRKTDTPRTGQARPQRYKSNHNGNDKALRALHIHVFPPQASRNQVYIFYACQTNVKLYLFPTKSR